MSYDKIKKVLHLVFTLPRRITQCRMKMTLGGIENVIKK